MTTSRTDIPQVQFDSDFQEAYLNLWRTYDCLHSIEKDLFARWKLSAQQYNALRLLDVVYPGTVPTLMLAQKLITRSPDITRLLDKLEARGWISRERLSDNRRVVRVKITPEGRELLHEIEAPLRACHEQQLGHLSHKELLQLTELLRTARRPHEQRRHADSATSD